MTNGNYDSLSYVWDKEAPDPRRGGYNVFKDHRVETDPLATPWVWANGQQNHFPKPDNGHWALQADPLNAGGIIASTEASKSWTHGGLFRDDQALIAAGMVPDRETTTCHVCEPGRYTNVTTPPWPTSCFSCPPGSEAPLNGSAYCSLCAPGKS